MYLAWSLLLLAVAFEVFATIQLKLSDGFTKMNASIFTVLLFTLSFACAAFAFKKIDLSVGYAMWSGLGTVGIIGAGILFFDEPSSLMKMSCVALILIGVIGLNLHS